MRLYFNLKIAAKKIPQKWFIISRVRPKNHHP